jgi:type II secretory pathway pseudopilin PulG
MKRIKCFTVIELIVGMIISSIVLGIAFYALIIFNTGIKNYSQKSNTVNEYLLFRNVFYRDWDHALLIKKTINGICMYGKYQNYPEQEYLFDSSKIVRNSKISRDTFKLGNTLTRLELCSDEIKLIKLIQCKIYLNDQNIQFTIQKNYAALELMSAEKISDDK